MMMGTMMSGLFVGLMGLMGMMSLVGPFFMMMLNSMLGPMAQMFGMTASQ